MSGTIGLHWRLTHNRGSVSQLRTSARGLHLYVAFPLALLLTAVILAATTVVVDRLA
jgi:hypothetical protein